MVAVRKLLVVVGFISWLSVGSAFGSAANAYVTSSGGAVGNCPSGATTFTPAQFNSSANWGSGTSQIGPGTTVLICGTFTIPANTSGFTTQGNGTSSSPIIILFDTGAVVQSATPGQLPGGCPTCLGLITVNNSDIIVDGQNTGMIQSTSTAAGQPSGCASNGCLGIDIRDVSNVIIRNLTIQHIYNNNPAGSGSAGFYTGDIFIETGATGIEICNNTLNNAHTGIWSDTTGSNSSPPAATQASCNSNTFAAGTNYFLNTISDHGWAISLNGGSGAPNVYNNALTSWTNWGNQADATYHTDGIITYSDGATKISPYIFNNSFIGDLGTASATGMIFCTYNGSNGGSSCTVFNNVFVGQGVCATGQCAAVYIHAGSIGPNYFYNNTFVNFGVADLYVESDMSMNLSVENQIFLGCSACVTWGYSKNDTNYTNLLVWDHDAGYTLNPGGGYNSNTFSQWQSMGFDTNGAYGNPNISSAPPYTLSAGSSAIGLGANLTSSCSGVLTALCKGAPQTFGAGGSCGSGCLSRAGSGAWDAGAYPYTALAPPTKLAAAVN
jgi:hypothetical protein